MRKQARRTGAKKSSPDKVEKNLLNYKDVFADIINVLVHGGRDVVKEKNLVDGSPAAIFKAAEGNIGQKDRDEIKFDIRGGVEYAAYGFENQTTSNLAMPVRTMLYDAAAYDRIISKIKEQNRHEKKEAYSKEIHVGQKIYPVVTLVLYFGITPWDGPRTLYDMMDVPEEMKKFVPDYHINLVEVAFLPEETIKQFKSDFRIVADFFRAKRLGKESEMQYNKEKWIHVAELLEFFRTFASDKRFSEIKQAMLEEFKGGDTVCMDDFFEKFVEKGRQEGRQEGKFEILEKYIANNSCTDEEALEILDFTAEEAERYKQWKTSVRT